MKCARGDYKNLDVWKRSIVLIKMVYPIALRLPAIERYAMADQIRRAATSIALNIAEGYTRQSDNELCHFLSIARGSAAEVEAQLLICIELEYITKEEAADVLTVCDEVKRKLYHFMMRIRG